MPLSRIVYCFNARTLKIIQVYQNVLFNRKCSSSGFNCFKGLFFEHTKNEVSLKYINFVYDYVMAETHLYERVLYDELLEELGLHKILGNELKYFFSMDISQLNHLGVELDRGEIARNVVQHLEPFPFDIAPIYNYGKCKRDRISIKTILILVEAQYLAQRLNLEFKLILSYFKIMKNCLFYYKSMRSVKRNLDMLLADGNFKHLTVFDIIFFLNNQRPFSLKQLNEVEKDLFGMSWKMVVHVCPHLVKHSYQGIMFRINMLRALGFTDEQIRLGLPYLGVRVSNIYSYVNYILSTFGKYKNDEFFLRLLGCCFSQQRRLYGMAWESYEALQKAILLREEKRQSLLKSKEIMFYLQEKLRMTKQEWKVLRKHPAPIVKDQVFETLKFLETNDFTVEEILESITIVLYPVSLIKKNLAKLAEEDEKLQAFGFKNGCVEKPTNYFTTGTKLRKKTLQLCLYYLEKGVYLSGDTFLDLDKVNEETTRQTAKVQAVK